MAGVYPAHFERFVASLGDLDFASSMQKCRENGFLYPGTLKPALEAHGVEVMEALVDVMPLQERWAAENGVQDLPQSDRIDAILIAQLQAFKPDVVYFQSLFPIRHATRRALRHHCPSIRLIFGHRGFPCFDCSDYSDIDFMLLGYPKHHGYWWQYDVDTVYSPHVFDPGILPKVNESKRENLHPFTFIGSTGYGFINHDARYYELRRLMEETDLEIWGNEWMLPRPKRNVYDQINLRLGRSSLFNNLLKAVSPAHPYFGAVEAELKKVVSEEYWFYSEKPISHLYPSRFHDSVFGIDYFALLANSQVTWNKHLNLDGAGANMRLFEASGVGACQLVDLRDEIAPEFEPDSEVIVYSGLDDCIEKYRYLSEHPEMCKAVGKAAQARALRDHTPVRLAQEIVDSVRVRL
jgi:spore maturation protein CgeB